MSDDANGAASPLVVVLAWVVAACGPTDVGKGQGAEPGRATSPDDAAVSHSRLVEDLQRGHRDSLLRALTFVERRGGPPRPNETSFEALAERREPTLEWIRAQQERERLERDYEAFTSTWSPIFSD